MELYLDTSVLGGQFDAEFAQWTNPLIQSFLLGKHIPIISDLTIEELENAPTKVRNLLEDLIESPARLVMANETSDALADEYIARGALTIGSKTDARHIALATLTSAYVLVSWNFKHIVNVNRIRLFHSVNVAYGYGLIDIRSPMEIEGYEK